MSDFLFVFCRLQKIVRGSRRRCAGARPAKRERDGLRLPQTVALFSGWACAPRALVSARSRNASP
jgi:hypothetical protein